MQYTKSPKIIELLTLSLILSAFFSLSCSKTETINNENSPNSNASTVTLNLNSVENAQDNTSSNSQESALIKRKPCVKKSGWLRPSSKERYISDKPTKSMMPMKNGKEVEVTTNHFGYNIPWSHSLEINCESNDWDYLKGKLETPWFMEVSFKGRVFMYSIFVKSVSEDYSAKEVGEERYIYQIQDSDGDGIFETLLNSYNEEVFVPEWVQKK